MKTSPFSRFFSNEDCPIVGVFRRTRSSLSFITGQGGENEGKAIEEDKAADGIVDE